MYIPLIEKDYQYQQIRLYYKKGDNSINIKIFLIYYSLYWS